MLTEDREEAGQWLTDQKRQRRKRKRSNKQLDVATSAALKHQEVPHNIYHTCAQLLLTDSVIPLFRQLMHSAMLTEFM